ncbi:hypothetical protein G5I_04901 [Acromyrmex echinatior]|uniref:Uncharacterized protein n=1 Tax=Acromyrmex echinatior TaxID=103372 RepID=F4WGV0_ACREC|nr:hypothetical protein G5I_04901 [Acromyrmex echinatior]
MVSRYDDDNDNDDGLSIDLARAIIGNFPPPRRHKARVDMAQTRDPRDIPSSSRLIFDVPTFLAMTSRAQPR